MVKYKSIFLMLTYPNVLPRSCSNIIWFAPWYTHTHTHEYKVCIILGLNEEIYNMYIFIPEPYKKWCVFIYTSSRGTSMFHTAIAPSAEQETNCLDSWRYRRACTFSLKENQKSFQYLYLNYWTISIIQYVAWGTTSANWLEVIWMVDHSKQNSSVLVQAEIHFMFFFFFFKI